MDQLRVAKWPQQIVAVTAVVWCFVDASAQTERQAEAPAADILARYPGQDDYVSKWSLFLFVGGGGAG